MPLWESEIVKGVVRALRITLFVENGLDQDVNIQVKGNEANSVTGAINLGSPFTIPANSNGGKTLTPEACGYLPYIYVELSCTTAPTTGSISVYLIYGVEDKFKLVDALEIRDTAIHDPSTDPDRIKIAKW